MKNGGGEACQGEDVHDERKDISYDQLLTPDLKRKKRKQELLSRAERVLGLAQRLDGFEDTHVSAGSVAHRVAADYAVDNLATRGQKDKEDQQRSEDESDGEDSEADLDFDDLVRLYGPLPPLRRRRRRGADEADDADPRVGDSHPKEKYNLSMAIVMMVVLSGLLCTIFAQMHGQDLWLQRQREQCHQSTTEAVAQERGKVAGQHLDFERKKWRQEFDLQIRRTREHVEAECLKSQNDCQRNLEACNSIKTDLSDKCEIQLDSLRRELFSSTSSPPSGAGAVEAAQVVATELACQRSEKQLERCSEEACSCCSKWCLQQATSTRFEDLKVGADACDDAVGKAVAAERKLLQESALNSRTRAIEKVLQGDHKGAAAEVAAVVCVTKDDCSMEKVINEAILKGRKEVEAKFVCRLLDSCETEPQPQLEDALNAYWNRISRCAFDGNCAAPEVLLKKISETRKNDLKKVHALLQAQARAQEAAPQGQDSAGIGDGQDGVAQVQNRAGNGSADTGQGVEEGMEAEVGSREEMIGEVMSVVQDMLSKTRAEEGKKVRQRTEAQYQQMLLQYIDKTRQQEQTEQIAAAQAEERKVAEVTETLMRKIHELTAVIKEQEHELQNRGPKS